jgi:hypothetical protein
MKELESVITKKEGKNPKLLFEMAQLFLRVCGRNQRVISYLRAVIDKCRKAEPLNADFAIEQGRQLVMIGQID